MTAFLRAVHVATALTAVTIASGGCAQAAPDPRKADASGPTPAPLVTGSENPQSRAPVIKPDGRSLTIAIARLGAVTVTPLSFLDGHAKCAVDLRIDDGPAQRVVVIGEGETEALTCDKIIAVGDVPAPVGTARIAFLYRASSIHASVLQPVFLVHPLHGGGAWTSDDALAQSVGENGELETIPRIRAYLDRTGG